MHSKILVCTLHNHSLNIGTDILFQKVIRIRSKRLSIFEQLNLL